MFNKRGQVWIETMIYTLIAFSMIALVLAFAKPKIEEFQDKAVIEQSVTMLEEINALILAINQGGPGNVRVPQLLIKKGALIIDGVDDMLIFEMDSNHMYSQLNEEVPIGGMTAKTIKRGKYYNVRITMDYSESLNITYKGEDTIKNLNKASTKQPLSIRNKGENILLGTTVCWIDTVPDPDEVKECNEDPSIWRLIACADDPATITTTELVCKYKSEKIVIDMEIK